jgi:catalase
LVPGIEASPDKMLQGRLFSYNDTHRHRLGPNYSQIPINAPLKGKLNHYSRDGLMSVNGNGGDAPNYEPNSFNGPVEDSSAKETPMNVYGQMIRSPYVHPNNNYEQPSVFWSKVLSDQEKTFLVENIVGHLKNAKKEIQIRQVGHFMKVDKVFGTRISQGLGLSNI